MSVESARMFTFSYPTCTKDDVFFKLEVPIDIPYEGSTRELVQRVISMFHIPVYYEEELNEKLEHFVQEETRYYHNDRDEKLLNLFKVNQLDVDGIVKAWEKQFKENVVEFAEQKGTSDEEVFAEAYHKLVHSPALETILQVENSYAATVMKTISDRDEDIRQLTQRQTEEMEALVARLGVDASEGEINAAAARHFDEQSAARGRWGSQLDALGHAQRATHRAWLMDALGTYCAHDADLPTPSNSPLAIFNGESIPSPESRTQERMEESFTIHLGSQLKQTHNLRIVAMDMMDLCTLGNDSRRLQTALALYSSALAACVVVCEAAPCERLLRAAHASTDHHFAPADAQVAHALHAAKAPAERRNASRADGAPRGRRAAGALQPGDVVVTRHSNLAEVHVVFQLIADDSSLKGEISSRHPALLGLRSVLKAACCHDVATLAIPLLLRHHLAEEMTGAWCLRRAELVLKCVKGFMLETAGWGGRRLRTVQLVLPRGVAPAVFAALAALVPDIFAVPTPLKLTASAT